ncbi:MAG: type II toxin-antitoxin system PemK/MazF family toxin [Patescibacteria group bacterium]
MYIKDFDKWNEMQKHLNSVDEQVNIRAGEVRWVAFGINVGSEIDGKGVSFTRPALITHVVGSNLALVVPLSTKVKEITGYVPFEFQGRIVSLCIHQSRTISQKRILARKGKISEKRLDEVKKEIKKFFAL